MVELDANQPFFWADFKSGLLALARSAWPSVQEHLGIVVEDDLLDIDRVWVFVDLYLGDVV